MDRTPDVEAVFEFNGTRMHPAADGYRPAHLITNNYLTTGVHHYYQGNAVPPNGSAKGTITFLSPEAYPHCLWIGKKIAFQEGARVVGYATITRIFNPLLCLESGDSAALPTAPPHGAQVERGNREQNAVGDSGDDYEL